MSLLINFLPRAIRKHYHYRQLRALMERERSEVLDWQRWSRGQ